MFYEAGSDFYVHSPDSRYKQQTGAFLLYYTIIHFITNYPLRTCMHTHTFLANKLCNVTCLCVV